MGTPSCWRGHRACVRRGDNHANNIAQKARTLLTEDADPEADKNYFLFNEGTRWKMPGAKDFLTLSSMQDFTIKYNQGQNIGLIAEDKSGGSGLFVLDETGEATNETLFSAMVRSSTVQA